LLNGIPPRGDPGERPPGPPTAANAPDTAAPMPAPRAPAVGNGGNTSATPPQPPQTTAGYRSLNEFVVTYQHGAGDARYSAILRREGLFAWKLAAVNLNE
jgi:hypothetical protein